MYMRFDKSTELWGYWGDGNWLVHPQFCEATPFAGGYASVLLANGERCIIAKDGRVSSLHDIINHQSINHGDIDDFIGFLPDYDLPIQYAPVCINVKGRRNWGLIDLNLDYHPLPYKTFSSVSQIFQCDNYLIVAQESNATTERRCGLYNTIDNQMELPIKHKCIYPSPESIWSIGFDSPAADTSGGYMMHYNLPTKSFLPGTYTYASAFFCGFSAVQEGRWDATGRSFFVRDNSDRAFGTDFETVDRFSHGLASVSTEDAYGYIDTTGRLCLVLDYERLMPFNRLGLAIANRDECEWDLDIIDRRGTVVLQGLETVDFVHGDFPYFEVTINGETHLFDAELELIF